MPYTRIHEFRHYHPEPKGPFANPRGTIITREYPVDWQRGDEPYYPIATPESAALLAKYQAELARYNQAAERSNGSAVVCGGRLGQYRYYDMDKSVAAALELAV